MRDRNATLDWFHGRAQLVVARCVVRSTDRLGYPVPSAYGEMFWLPLIGPSAYLAFRHLHLRIGATTDRVSVPVESIAACLGLGTGTGRTSSIARTLARLVDFRLASIDHDTYLLVRELPLLSDRYLARLPAELLTAHEQLIQGSTRSIDPTFTDTPPVRHEPAAPLRSAPR